MGFMRAVRRRSASDRDRVLGIEREIRTSSPQEIETLIDNIGIRTVGEYCPEHSLYPAPTAKS
jgi:hypothetical protein